MPKLARLDPLLWGSLILITSQTFTLYIAFREKLFVETHQITSPEVPLGLPLLYFLGAVVLIGATLFLVPVDKLKIVFRIMFTFLFAWGTFITLALTLPIIAASLISIVGGLIWLFKPKVWLHNLLMILTLASVGAVFGFLLSPWIAISFMLIISVYDIIAVRSGYMLWMAKKLSESETIPAFVIPKKVSAWNLSLNEAGFNKLFEDEAAEREFSILGGGDIGFPLLLLVSMFFAHGFTRSAVVAVFSVLGLISAYLIQLYLLKGKPIPALPPISFLSLIGFIIVYFI